MSKPIGSTKQTILFVKEDSLTWYHGNLDSIDSGHLKWIQKNEFELKYSIRRRVVQVDSVFYIKEGVRSKTIISKFKNRVVNF